MENSTAWAEMQQNPPVNLVNPIPQIDLYAQSLYPNAHYAAYYPHSQNPNPNPDPLQLYSTNALNAVIHPPGVEPYVTVSVNSYPDHVSSGPETQQQLASRYSCIQRVASGSTAIQAYYQDPNVVSQALNPFGTGVTVSATVAEKLVVANATSSLLINQTVGSQRSSARKKVPKKIKVAQSAWCEICKVDCNSKSVLDQHKLGKKHKKNLEKLITANASVLAPVPALAPATAPTPSALIPPLTLTVSNSSIIAPQGNLDKVKSASGLKAKKKAAQAEDLETKRRKMLEGGAAVEDVRTCAVCNVVCNSETVFRYHLAGQKHAAMMKKHASTTGMTATR